MANKKVDEKQADKTAQELQKPRWTQEELLKIFDQILFEGEYSEEVTVRGKLKVIFKSRSGDETLAISKELDSLQLNLITTVEQLRALRNLSYSLVNYQGRDFSDVKLAEKMIFLGKLPISVIAILSDKLAEFDSKIDAACREAEENF